MYLYNFGDLRAGSPLGWVGLIPITDNGFRDTPFEADTCTGPPHSNVTFKFNYMHQAEKKYTDKFQSVSELTHDICHIKVS